MRGAAPKIEIYDRRGAGLIAQGALPERICEGMRWTEGPLVQPGDGSLLFSDIPNNRVMRWTGQGAPEIWKSPSNFANGRTLDREGNILTCEHGGRRVTRTRPDGRYEVVVESYRGRRLNSPNDVVVRAEDGSVWFTDPPYGIESDYEGYKAESEQDANNVFRFDPSSAATVIVADDFDRPNGLAFSPDGSRLYIADSGASLGAGHPDPFVPERNRHIRVFDVAEDGRLSGGGVFAVIDAGVPDGLRVDRAGRVWSSARDGVHCYDVGGDLLLKVLLPEITSNLVIDERGARQMFITASASVYRLALGAV